MSKIIEIIKKLEDVEINSQKQISMIASENIISPLARIPFILDSQARYFLDDLRLFGEWVFPNGEALGRIEQEILVPLLRKKTNSTFVNVKPISGINCMTIALAALTKAEDTIYTVPVEFGGHASTSIIAERLGINVRSIPFINSHDIDYSMLEEEVFMYNPKMVYIDQATFLFPIDPAPIRKILNNASCDAVLYYDSSHINGLVVGGAVFNPLERGADVFGGSTHKTLPGPHKGFLATNNESMAARIQMYADHFVSHHHIGSVISLAVTIAEMEECNGEAYAASVIDHANLLASHLYKGGYRVMASDRGFSQCHQVLIQDDDEMDLDHISKKLRQVGVIVNKFPQLPGLNTQGFRLSTAEITRLGATGSDIIAIGDIFLKILRNDGSIDSIKNLVAKISRKLNKPRYCFDINQIRNVDFQKRFDNLLGDLAV